MSRAGIIAVALLYAGVLCAVAWGMFYARDTLAPRLASEAGQAAWNAWRQDAAAGAEGLGPVARRAPTTAEPPLVVLMRDHFAVCLTGAVVFSSLLFAVLTIVIRGAFQRTEAQAVP